MAMMDRGQLTSDERLVAEQAVLNLRTLNAACAADGTVLGIAEQLAVKRGREATRRVLEITLQSQDADREKKFVEPDLRLRTDEGFIMVARPVTC